MRDYGRSIAGLAQGDENQTTLILHEKVLGSWSAVSSDICLVSIAHLLDILSTAVSLTIPPQPKLKIRSRFLLSTSKICFKATIRPFSLWRGVLAPSQACGVQSMTHSGQVVRRSSHDCGPILGMYNE